MIIDRIYWDRQEVIRIYQCGKLIWPAEQASTDVVLSIIENLFAAGYHMLVDSNAIVLAPSADIVAAVHGELIASQAAVLNPQNDNVFAVHGGLSVIHRLYFAQREDNVTAVHGDLSPTSITSFTVKGDNVAAVHGDVDVLHIVTFAQREDNVSTVHGGFTAHQSVSIVVQQHSVTNLDGDMFALPAISLDDVTDIVARLHSNVHIAPAASFDYQKDIAASADGNMLSAPAASFDYQKDIAASADGNMLPAPAKSLNHIIEGAADLVGAHTLSVTDVAAMNSDANNSSTISAMLSTLFAKNIITLDCNVGSFSQNEIEAVIGGALSCTFMDDSKTSETAEMSFYWHKRMSHSAGYATDIEASMQPAIAISGVHAEDIANADEFNVHLFSASRMSHKEDMDVTDEAHVEVATAVHMPCHVEDSGTTHLATMMTIKASDIVYADVAEDNTVCDGAHIDSYEHVSMGALLHLVTTCHAGMHISHTSGMRVDAASKTGIVAVLDFDGAIPEVTWYDPVQSGSDLYIRQTYEDPLQEGTNLDISEVFFEPVQTGSNLHIISLASFGGE